MFGLVNHAIHLQQAFMALRAVVDLYSEYPTNSNYLTFVSAARLFNTALTDFNTACTGVTREVQNYCADIGLDLDNV